MFHIDEFDSDEEEEQRNGNDNQWNIRLWRDGRLVRKRKSDGRTGEDESGQHWQHLHG